MAIVVERANVMDPRVTEQHCIMPIANLPSVIEHGILSYDRAAHLAHSSVALQPVQDRRDKKRVPNGLWLHQYANLYFHARNPMLFKRLNEAGALCILCVSLDVLSVPNVVLTDSNAASGYVRFLHPSQWALINFEDVFAADWRHPNDQSRFYQHKSRKCAEILVPDRVTPEMVIGARVIDAKAQDRLNALALQIAVTIDPVLFFRQ